MWVGVNKAKKLWLMNFQVSLAEAVEKYKQAMECNAQLENKNSDLMYQVNTLQGSVQQLKVELSQTYRKCDMITVVSKKKF